MMGTPWGAQGQRAGREVFWHRGRRGVDSAVATS
jgi:hypothetical protein